MKDDDKTDWAVTSDAARTQTTRASDSTDNWDVRTGEPGRDPGQIISHYRLEKRLGAGGMGEIWMATDLALGRPTAIKLLRDELSESMRARLRREAKASARLQHPGIATFYDSGEDKGTTWLAMEHVAGETLRQKLRRGPLDVDDTLSLAAGLLEALIHAHAAGVLHRDIKPDNIMLTSGRTAKLLDFGLAKWIGEQGDPTPAGAGAMSMVAEALTAHGAIAGTLGYMSPEQLRGETVDARTDVFAVGAVIHEMLAGRPAFPGATVQERVDAVLSKPAPPLDLAGAPPGLDQNRRFYQITSSENASRSQA